MQKNVLNCSVREKVMYSVGDAGGYLILMLISSYLTLYYTDNIGLAAAYAGTMMLVCRIFDGVSDIIVGILIDSTHTRWGKARPWFVLSILPMLISFISVFNIPKGLSVSGLKIYTVVTYFLVTVVFYTINNIAYHAMLQRFSFSSQDRSAVSGVRSIVTIIAGTLASIATPILIPLLGGEKNQHTWTVLVLIYGGISTIFLGITALGIKERLSEQKIEETTDSVAHNKRHIINELKLLLKCKYFYLAIALVLAYTTSSNMTGINYYYARDVIGDTNFLSLGGAVGMIPMIVGTPFIPLLFKKLGKRRTMIGGLIFSTACSLGILINPQSIPINLIFGTLKTVGTLPVIVALATLAGDISDYNHMRNGVRSEGLTTSAYSIGLKLGTGLGAAIVGWMLTFGHYSAELAIQPDSAISAMIITSAVIPAIIYVVSIIILGFWDIEKYQPEVQDFMKKQILLNDERSGQ